MTAPNLTEFLLARVADDLLDAAGYGDDGTPGTWSHWARAVCEAHRLIVAAHPLTTDAISQGYVGKSAGFGCSTCHDWDGMTEALGNCETLRALAQPYADHPDYREEWRP